MINEPGIIIGRKGTVGAVHYSKEAFWPIDITFYITEAPHRDLRFTYYLLKFSGLNHMNSDSAVPGLNCKAVHSKKITIPDLIEQRWIGHIHWIILRAFIPHEDILKPLNGQGDPLFEIIRYIQMNPSPQKIKNAIPNHPTPALEFSVNSDIAPYFSSYKKNEDGGIYCLKKASISTAFSFNDALDTMIQE